MSFSVSNNFKMAPPSAIHTHETVEGGASVPTNSHGGPGTATHDPGLTKAQAEKAEVEMPKFPAPKKFEDKYQEREYQKGRLVLAFRIFAKLGFDEGVAGHITLRVSSRSESKSGDGWESSGGQMEGFGGVKIGRQVLTKACPGSG
jgi:hypothetical protein